jgi:hypothetical protein
MMVDFARSTSSDARPPYVVLKGRRTSTKADRNHLLPLMPSEVQPGTKVDLHFSAPITCDIVMQSAAIFIMKADQINPFLHMEPTPESWLIKPSNLLDFVDAKPRDRANAEGLAHRVAATVVVSEGLELDAAPVRALVRAMYTPPLFTRALRSALVRIAAVRPLVAEWVESLREVIRAGAIPAEMWPYVWRDFVLFPREAQAGLQSELWDAKRVVGSLASVLAAFSYHSD